MADFNFNEPRWVTGAFAKTRIQDAWIGLTAGDSYLSQVIRYGTQGVHSHVGMFRRTENGENNIDFLEMVMGGGRTKTIEFHIEHGQRVDVFSPCKDGMYKDIFDPTGAVAAMRMLVDYDYGLAGLCRMALYRVPLVWRLYPPTTEDRLPEDGKPIRQPFCSHAVSLATQLGGHVDVVPRCPNWRVSPADLCHSMFYDYEFTLVTGWARQRYSADILEIAKANEHFIREHAA